MAKIATTTHNMGTSRTDRWKSSDRYKYWEKSTEAKQYHIWGWYTTHIMTHHTPWHTAHIMTHSRHHDTSPYITELTLPTAGWGCREVCTATDPALPRGSSSTQHTGMLCLPPTCQQLLGVDNACGSTGWLHDDLCTNQTSLATRQGFRLRCLYATCSQSQDGECTFCIVYTHWAKTATLCTLSMVTLGEPRQGLYILHCVHSLSQDGDCTFCTVYTHWAQTWTVHSELCTLIEPRQGLYILHAVQCVPCAGCGNCVTTIPPLGGATIFACCCCCCCCCVVAMTALGVAVTLLPGCSTAVPDCSIWLTRLGPVACVTVLGLEADAATPDACKTKPRVSLMRRLSIHGF